MGRIESGSIRVGDNVILLPSGLTSGIKEILFYEGPRDEAFAPQSVTLTIEDHLDISRGDMFVKSGDSLRVTKAFDAMLCWFSEQPLDSNWKYVIKQSTRIVKAVIKHVDYRVDVNTLSQEKVDTLKMNDLAYVGLKL